jgi:hypothetical protein
MKFQTNNCKQGPVVRWQSRFSFLRLVCIISFCLFRVTLIYPIRFEIKKKGFVKAIFDVMLATSCVS